MRDTSQPQPHPQLSSLGLAVSDNGEAARIVKGSNVEVGDWYVDRGRSLTCHLDNIAMVTLRPPLSLVLAVSPFPSPRHEQIA